MNGNQPGGSTMMTNRRGVRPCKLLSGIRKLPDQENLWSPGSDCSSSDENNSPTALNSFNWDKPALEDKSVHFGWSSSHSSGNTLPPKLAGEQNPNVKTTSSGYVTIDSKAADTCNSSKEFPKTQQDYKHSGGLYPSFLKTEDKSKTLNDTLEEKHESDSSSDERSEEDILKEREELRNVAWFQAGIPREIALEVLSEKPEGSFIVRQSTTKPGCYALSLRVPTSKNPTGIAHYLILHTSKGYKIKGFSKEFSTLNSLILHHSVMPELLPCPLDLCRPSVRDAEHEFEETEQKRHDIFTDIHWVMTEP